MYFEKGKGYEIRINLKQKGLKSPVLISMDGEKGIYECREILLSDTEWQRFSFKLRSEKTDKDGFFTITFRGAGTLWLGTVSIMPEDHINGFRKDVIEVIKATKPPNMRWPGGNFVSSYFWEDGIGDRDKRPPKPNLAYAGVKGEEWESNQPMEPNDVGIDEFLKLCVLLETKPFIAVNAGSGSPEDAANLVEYCNSSMESGYGEKRAKNGYPEPYNVELWGIGNEMFGNWQGGHVDEETYAHRHLKIAQSMRGIDPNIKIVATGGRNWFYPGWNRALFKIAQGSFDYISLHSYAKKYRNFMSKEDLLDPEFAKEFYYYIVSSPYGIEEQIVATGKEIEDSLPEDTKVSVAFDEWNCWAYKAPRMETEFALRDGLYTAGVLHGFRRQNKTVTLANFAMTVNCLPMIRVNQFGLFVNPQYLVFKIYMNHQGPVLLQSSVDCETFPAPDYEKDRPQAIGNIKYVDVSATQTEDGKRLFLAMINLHDSRTIETEIFLQNWPQVSTGKLIYLDGKHYMTENSFDEPDNIRIEEQNRKKIKNPMVYQLPPHSVTIWEQYKMK